MKRLCVFAHWDRDSIVDDYVIYYLKELQKVSSTIIFVSDCDLNNDEICKVSDIADYVIAQKHGEYDFGSYKKGFLFAKENNIEFDELLFVNDSCYGPFYPLKSIFDKMSKKKCDFWGFTASDYGLTREGKLHPDRNPHIQSYFIIFRKPVIESNIFNTFINDIKKEDSKADVINNYEIGLSNLLCKNKFKKAVFINKYHYEVAFSTKWKQLIERDGFPFIKTVLIKKGVYYTGPIKGWEDVIRKHSDYPVEYIIKNSERLHDFYEDLYSKQNLYRKIRFKILTFFPIEVRFFVVFLEKYLFLILNTIFFNKLKKF